MIKRALISVFDKIGVLDFSKFLAENGVEVISTGGTYKHLKENGVAVAGICHSCSNTGCGPHLQTTLQLAATWDP